MPIPLLNRRACLATLLSPLTLAACGGGGASPQPDNTAAASPAPVPLPVPAAASAPVATTVPPTTPSSDAGRWKAVSMPVTPRQARQVFAPAVGMAPQGRAVMAWVQREGVSPPVNRLYACALDPVSVTWTAPELLDQDGDESLWPSPCEAGWNPSPRTVQVMAHEGGDASVVWHKLQPTGNDPTLYLRRWRAASGRWSEVERLDGRLQGSALCGRSSAGHVAIAWCGRASDGSPRLLRVRVESPDGSVRLLERPLSGGLPRALAVDALGRVALSTLTGATLSVLLSDTPAWLAPIEVTTAGLVLAEKLAFSPDGELLVAWTDRLACIRTLFYRDGTRHAFAPPIEAAASCGKPDLLWTPQGWAMIFIASSQPAVLFFENSTQNCVPCLIRHDAATGRWMAPSAIGGAQPLNVGRHQLVGTADGGLLALLYGDGVAAYSLDPGAHDWGQELRATNGLPPELAWDTTSGRALVVWPNGTYADATAQVLQWRS